MSTLIVNGPETAAGSTFAQRSEPRLRFVARESGGARRFSGAPALGVVGRLALKEARGVIAASVDRPRRLRDALYPLAIGAAALVALAWPAGDERVSDRLQVAASPPTPQRVAQDAGRSTETGTEPVATKIQPSATKTEPTTAKQPNAASAGGLPAATKASAEASSGQPSLKAPLTPPTATPKLVPGAAPSSPRFAWAPVAGATAYRFALYRAGERIYVARTVAPVLQLPRTWKQGGGKVAFGPGGYQWVVWAIRHGRQDGAAVVRAKVVVPKAT